MYADEMPAEKDEDVIYEAKMIRAEGTGVTGGDPLLSFERTERLIRMLKENFNEHHIHLYSGTMDHEKVEKLVNAGLDEFRFHPRPEHWGDMGQYKVGLSHLLDLSMDLGVEIPGLPDKHGAMENLASFLDGMDVLFLNINELEFSQENYEALLGKGYKPRDDVSAAMDQSREKAMSILEYANEEGLALSVHYCSSGFKDSVQLRNRLIRRAETIGRAMDVVTDDGTILKGVVELVDSEPGNVVALLIDELGVSKELVEVDWDKKRVEVAPWALEKVAEKIPFPCYIIEEYPTWDRLEVERTPLEKGVGKKGPVKSSRRKSR